MGLESGERNDITRIGFAKVHFVARIPRALPHSGDQSLILRRASNLFVVRALESTRRRVWTGVSLVMLLVFCQAAPARSPRIRMRARLRPPVALVPAALVHAALLEPGVLPADEAGVPVEGAKYELKLHHLHSGETLDVVYRIGDTYIPEAIDKLDYFLRDSRTQDEKSYDPSEFDLLHNLMARLGRSDGIIDIVCGYRTPWSNAFLRSRSRHTGVAKNSQHVQARAIDIRVPGVRTRYLRDAALSLVAGGVGYYPRSQFVHVDVGPVRRWTFAGRGED
jgi:uncharacterized protein YcbK (DUF882 family)